MGRRIAVYGATDEALQLLPVLASHPDLEVAAVFDPQAAVHRRRLAILEPPLAALLQRLLTDDPRALDDPSLGAVLDAGIAPPFAERFPDAVARGLEVLTPAAAQRAWATPTPTGDTKRELLQALEEIAAAVELAAAPDALFARLLEVAIHATGAAGGSLLLREPDAEVLGVRAAVGLERELWPKVRVSLGAGIAGRVWAEGRAIAVRGRANPAVFEIARPRFDVAASLCVPLPHAGAVSGVLNLHHPTRGDLFSEGDVAFGDALGVLVARIAARAESTRALRHASLCAGVPEAVAALFAERAPLEARLAALCRLAASRAGRGAATLWWCDEPRAGETAPLRLAASSHEGGGLGAAARLAPGDGIDGAVARDREAVFLRRGDRLAYAALPLLAGAKLLGVLSVQPGCDAPAAEDEEQALRAIAAAAATALDSELRTSRAEARATRGEALHEATLRLLAERDPDRIAESVASSAALLLDAERAIVRALDPERRSFRVRARIGDADLDAVAAQRDVRVAREALHRRTLLDSAAHASEDDATAYLVAPLLHDGRALGTLAVYDKRGAGGPHFDALDRDLLARLAAVAARALAAALPDPAAAAPSERLLPFAQFAARIDEELARAALSAGDPHAFALVTCHIENQAEMPPELAARFARETEAAFVAQLRSFDVATRAATGSLVALLPVPGASPSEHVARLARAVAEAIAKGDDDTHRIALGFGYAVHADGLELAYGARGEPKPSDVSGLRSDLLARAAESRIRML